MALLAALLARAVAGEADAGEALESDPAAI
jgi:hypothetical protein